MQISRVTGVREVTAIKLFERATTIAGSDWKALPRDARDGTQTLRLSPWQLPELLSVIVVDGEATAVPDHLRALPNPFADERAVAVPLVPSVC